MYLLKRALIYFFKIRKLIIICDSFECVDLKLSSIIHHQREGRPEFCEYRFTRSRVRYCDITTGHHPIGRASAASGRTPAVAVQLERQPVALLQQTAHGRCRVAFGQISLTADLQNDITPFNSSINPAREADSRPTGGLSASRHVIFATGSSLLRIRH